MYQKVLATWDAVHIRITDLYRVRWQIEILFKEFKSGNVLRLSNVTKNQNILHMLMSASLTTYLL
ncbi:MAG: transposase, partial [Prevotella sp.]|nr:transposase [Prevotella sp.]